MCNHGGYSGVETDLWMVACSVVGACFGAFSGVVRRYALVRMDEIRDF